jgi:hypothetical protein
MKRGAEPLGGNVHNITWPALQPTEKSREPVKLMIAVGASLTNCYAAAWYRAHMGRLNSELHCVKGRDYLEELGVDARVILKSILKNGA